MKTTTDQQLQAIVSQPQRPLASLSVIAIRAVRSSMNSSSASALSRRLLPLVCQRMQIPYSVLHLSLKW
jgi:hypothetical protein